MSFTPFNAPLLAPLVGDTELAAHFSVRADIAAMLRFEAALARAEADVGILAQASATAIEAACDTFEADVRALGAGSARDGVVVPAFVAALRAHVGPPHDADVHFGATSQDVIDTSLMLRLKEITAILSRRLDALDAAFADLARRFGGRPLMARTRMQAAIEIRVADRIASWQLPLRDHRARLEAMLPDLLLVQFAGAAGTLDKLGEQGGDVRRRLAGELGLGPREQPWHSDRSGIVSFTNWLALVTGTLGKFGQDAALMAQNEMADLAIAGAGGSSAMPHKQNPVRAEVLVTLARFSATLAGGMQHAMVHEQERSGAAWTLEWMILPQMIVAAGAALRNALELCESVVRMGRE